MSPPPSPLPALTRTETAWTSQMCSVDAGFPGPRHPPATPPRYRTGSLPAGFLRAADNPARIATNAAAAPHQPLVPGASIPPMTVF